jgi:L-lactate dehydrogenase complex protein LldG
VAGDKEAPEPPVSSAARDAVLARIRHALPRAPEEQAAAEAIVAARLEAKAPNLVPARGQLDRDGRVQLFAELAAAVMADVRRLGTLEDVPAAVSGYLRQHNLPQKIALAPEPLLDQANWDSQPLLRVRRGTAVDADATGVTLAIAGVAETGTLVLASSPERPTLLAYLPETSVVVVAADWIEGSYEQAWESVRAMPGGVPRSVNFVTGPSRTADIAQKLELGAHGPKRLLVLIVDRLAG